MPHAARLYARISRVLAMIPVLLLAASGGANAAIHTELFDEIRDTAPQPCSASVRDSATQDL